MGVCYCRATKDVSWASRRCYDSKWDAGCWSSEVFPRLKKGLAGSCSGIVLFGDRVLECFVLKELKLMAGEMLRRRAMSGKLTPIDA